jgi:hypothetical protein
VKKKQSEQTDQPAGVWHTRRAICLWTVFATGLLIQALAPRLKIEDRAFVMPPIVNVQGAQIRPDALVRRERLMQTASGVFTVGAAMALAFYYRRTLVIAIRG